jgi:hypothetical protein
MRMRLLLGASALVFFSQTSSALADGVLPAVATPVQREQAQARFLRGKELFAKHKFDEALGELRASHEIVASPNTRLEVARCMLAMGKTIDAYAEFGRAAIEAKELTAQDNRYQRAYDAALAERAEIEPQLGFVALTVAHPEEETRITVGGEEIKRAAWNEPVPVAPGATEVVVTTPGRLPMKRAVTLGAGEKTSLDIDAATAEMEAKEPTPPPPALPPPPAPERTGGSGMRTGAYVAGAVGVVGLVGFAVFGVMAKSTYDDLATVCGGGPCPQSKADEISSGKTNQTIANVGLALGLIGAGVGGTLFALSLSSGAHGSSVALLASPGWIGVRGSL